MASLAATADEQGDVLALSGTFRAAALLAAPAAVGALLSVVALPAAVVLLGGGSGPARVSPWADAEPTRRPRRRPEPGPSVGVRPGEQVEGPAERLAPPCEVLVSRRARPVPAPRERPGRRGARRRSGRRPAIGASHSGPTRRRCSRARGAGSGRRDSPVSTFDACVPNCVAVAGRTSRGRPGPARSARTARRRAPGHRAWPRRAGRSSVCRWPPNVQLAPMQRARSNVRARGGSRRRPSRGARTWPRGRDAGRPSSQLGDAERRQVDADAVESAARPRRGRFGEPQQELALAAGDVEHGGSRRQVDERDDLVELGEARRIADTMVAMGDVVELPGVQMRPPCAPTGSGGVVARCLVVGIEPAAPRAASSRSSSGICGRLIFRRAAAGSNHPTRSISGNRVLMPECGGHSISNSFDTERRRVQVTLDGPGVDDLAALLR